MQSNSFREAISKNPVFHIYEVDPRDFWPTAKNNCWCSLETKKKTRKNNQSALEIETWVW